jgi:Ser/Thr protein kinase RdoA (MazF antagonist)
MSTRSSVERTAAGTWLKTFVRGNEAWYEQEVAAYTKVPFACPRLIRTSASTLQLEVEGLRRHAERSVPREHYLRSVWKLLERIHEHGVNHCDAHQGNIVWTKTGEPRLIDWEHSIFEVGTASYDLAGPVVSGVRPRGHTFHMFFFAQHAKAPHNYRPSK